MVPLHLRPHNWRYQDRLEVPAVRRTPVGSHRNLLALLDYTGANQYLLDARQEMIADISEWRNDPFDPHLVARHRILAYQKTVVMKYIDNLVAWGDQLFRQDSIESINQATLLYVLAA